MRRLVLVLFVVLVAAGAAGVRAESAPKSTPNPYWQVVDDTTEGRFEADESWGTSSYRLDTSDDGHRFAYRFARPDERGASAQFKVNIPETANYTVYASWPEVKGLSDSVPVGVETTSGLKWTNVNQQQDGGRWVQVGTFEMAAGDDYSVRVSPAAGGDGYTAADAVKVVEVPDVAPAEKPHENDKPSTTKNQDATKEAPPKESGTSPRVASPGASSRGRDVVDEARTYMGVPYRLGRASRSGADCSGFTMLVYRKFGVSLPHDVRRQPRYGSTVSGSPRAGDLVFFNEHGRGISHVGIATGRGTLIHSSDYYNRVTESQMKYVKGYVGAKRLLK